MASDLALEFLNAAHGDAILVHWGDPPRLGLVDGGPTGSFELALGPRLAQLRAERTSHEDESLALDLVCVSHIDDDHIAGVLRLLTDLRRSKNDGLPPAYQVSRLWHNSFEETVAAAPSGASVAQVQSELQGLTIDGPVAASVNQGRDVRDLARALGVDGNDPFHAPVIGGRSASIDGLNVTIVAPPTGALEALEEEWRKAKQSADPSVLAAAFDDRSVPNLSSICSLIGDGENRALLAADARGDRILEGLEAVGAMAPGGAIHLRLLQVPHHGSEHNSTQGFFERVTADHYVISADGIAHEHPHPDVLEWIVNARGEDAYAIHLTNPIPAALEKLRQLGVGRHFSVEVRADSAPSVTVSVVSTNG